MKVIKPITIANGSLTRASTATFIGADGLIHTAAADIARWQYDPLDLTASPRILLEEQRTNLALNSSVSTSGHGVTVTQNAIIAPNGEFEFDQVFEDSTSGDHYIEDRIISLENETTYVWSCFVKDGPSENRDIRLVVSGVSVFVGVNFNPRTKLIHGEEGVNYLDSGYKDFGGGVSLVWVKYASVGSAPAIHRVRIIKENNNGYVGDGSSSLYIWGAQCEAGDGVTSYIPTTSSPVTRAADIASPGLIYSSATELYAIHSMITDYSVGARCTADDKVFESLQTPNVGFDPTSNPLHWGAKGPSNRMAMLDSEISTQTSAASELLAVIRPGFCNSLALININGVSLEVEITNGASGPVVYFMSMSLDSANVADWYQYFFEPIEKMTDVVIANLPTYDDAYITVRINGGENVLCGSMIIGTVYDIGGTQYGLSAGIDDYSRKDTNATTGVTTFVKRNYAKRMSAELFVDNSQISKVYNLLASLRATPCVWIGVPDDNRFDFLTQFGWYGDFSVVIPYEANSLCSIEIKGLNQ